MPSGDVLIPQAALQLFMAILGVIVPCIGTLFWLAWKEKGNALDDYKSVCELRYNEVKAERDRVYATQAETQKSVVSVLAIVKEGVVSAGIGQGLLQTQTEGAKRLLEDNRRMLEDIKRALEDDRPRRYDREERR